ncbi:ATP-binding cassette domain-containing protein [Enterococcus saccharolyticus]|uniref:ATP-binding cassette domain-containing protein n=1 Tax=Enterococcus saccharolyticus TaxID=41997 RepID=UPI00039D1076|nr:hypothetical protein RV16_GL001720 [Enterococcus saccharolyticus]
MILSNISLQFEKEIYGLVGKSGSGKSTILKVLLGLFHPSEGTVRINNQNLDEFNLSSVY